MKRNQTRENNPNWKGGKTKHTHGYILVSAPEHPRSHNGYVFEHILVVEKREGRFIREDEVIHHENGIKNDNRSENLILTNFKKHGELHAIQKFGPPRKCKRCGAETRQKVFCSFECTKQSKKILWPNNFLDISKGKSVRQISKEIGINHVSIYYKLKNLRDMGELNPRSPDRQSGALTC